MISVPGLGSGLDVSSIVSQLVAIEGDNKTLIIADRISIAESEISAFGSLKSTLEGFQNSIATLNKKDTFSSRSVTSSDEKVFTVTGTGDLAVANYEIEVIDFAEAHKLITTGFADQSATVGTGQMTITVGSNAFTVTIDSTNNSLAGIRDAINEATDNTVVTASIANVDDGSGGTETKLILSSDKTGSENSISVSVNDDDGVDTDATGLSVFYYDTSDVPTPEQMTELTVAVDAIITIDGQTVTSSTNEFVDALEGITINILKEDPGNKHSLSVTTNKGAIKSAINVFIANFNSLNGVINSLTSVNTTTREAGLLVGNRTILTLGTQLRREMTNSVKIAGSTLENIVELGITTNASGNLVVDSTVLDAVMESNLDKIGDLFNSENGIANRLDSLVKDYVKSDGIIKGRTVGLNATIDRANKDLIALDASLVKLEDRLFRRFSALDLMLSQLNSVGDFLNSQLKAIEQIALRSRE